MTDTRPTHTQVKKSRKCSLDGCENPLKARGYCNRHYLQVVFHGKEPTIAPLRYDTTVRDSKGRKRCVTCGEWLFESSFHKSKKNKDGFSSTCGPCANWKVRGFHRHGLTEEGYKKLLEYQGGRCICGSDGPFVVDHDHSCCPGKTGCAKCVRGLLCQACNSAIGFARDDAVLLRQLADYLEGEWRK